MDGKQRLEVLHGIFHPDGERFNFAWEWLPASGLSVKDFIAPSSFRFGDGRMFQMGGKFGAVSFLQIVAPELSDRMLADFMDAENGIIVNLHIQSIDHNEAIKTIKRKITDLDRMKIEEQKKAIRSGYDMDIIPSDLATYGGEAKNLLRDLQSRNERMFLLTLLVLNLADTKQKLDNEVFGAAAIAQKYNCILTRLDYRQEQGLMSSIPLGENLIHIQRGLTTSSTAVFVPFTVQELFQSGEALYYGLNALSNNMILCDRKKLKNPKQTSIPKRLAYVSGELFEQYIHDMKIVQHFAMLNRQAMMDEIVKGMKLHVEEQFTTIHNYIDTDAMILRKGAVSAKEGEQLLIPINMRDGSLLCVGKGNEDWNCSAPHGAGRLMSRADAKQSFTVSEFKKQMAEVYTTSVNKATLDECPMAYKGMQDILDNIGPTADVVKVIRPIYNFKAGDEE